MRGIAIWKSHGTLPSNIRKGRAVGPQGMQRFAGLSLVMSMLSLAWSFGFTFTPCTAQWGASKYGEGKEVPLHVALVDEPAVAGEHAAAALDSEPVGAAAPSAEPADPPADPPESPATPMEEEEATVVDPVVFPLAPAVVPPPAAPVAHAPPLVLPSELPSPPPPKPSAPVAAPLRQYPPAAYAAADRAVAKPAVAGWGPHKPNLL